MYKIDGLARRVLPVSEARRLLPKLVEQIAREGGRVDVTRRGQPAVTIMRTSDVAVRQAARSSRPAALGVELLVPEQDLVDVIRELRSRTGQPRSPSPERRRTRRRTG
jgi:DNA-binding response OmpR family regulator